MDIQSSTLDDLFVLYPVSIPGWITPVRPAGIADGGVPKSLYDGQPQGLLCLIDPWTELKRQSWTMAAYDHANLYVNDDPTPVAGKTVKPGEEQDRIPLHIPHGQLTHGVNRLHYKVTRPGENIVPSRDLFVLYHLRAPGEPAPEGLDLLIPPDVVRDGVSAERAAQGVEFGFAYTNPRDYDRISFLVGNATIPFELTDASIPVTKTLFTDTFQQVGDNPNTLVEYRVTDQLGNSNQSPTKRLDIHLNQALNPLAPSVKEASGAILNPVNAKDTLTIVVPANSALRPDDKLRVKWVGAPGTPAGGSHTSGESLVSAGLEIEIPNSVVAFNLGKSVKVSYEVIRGNETPIPSPEFPLAVQPFAPGDLLLAKPKILEAANNGEGPELDVAALTGNATVRINSWPLIAVGQYVWLRLEGTKTDGSRYERTLWGDALGSRVSSQWVSAGYATNTALIGELRDLRDGSTLTVEFKATFNQSTLEAEAETFPLRTYTIKALADVLPPPGVEGVPEGGTLDPSQAQIWTRVPGNALLVGDEVVVIWTDKNGAVTEYRSPAKPYTAGDVSNNYLRFLIPSADVRRFVGTDVTVTYLRDRNGNITGPSQAFNMSVSVPVPLAFPSFTNEPYRTFPGGQLKDIVLLLSGESGAPVPNGTITLTLPSGFTYADGGTGPREFTTGTTGTATVSGVKGHTVPNIYSLTAAHGTQTATASVTIAALELIASILVGNGPIGVAVAPDGTRAYVCNHGSRTVSVIDTVTNQVLTNIPHSLEATEPPRYITVRPDGIRAYVCCLGLYGISTINTQTNQLLGGIASLYNGEGVTFSPDSTRAYATNGVRLFVINTANDGVLTSFAMGSGASDMAINPGGTRLYVSEFFNDKVAVVDTTTNQVLGRISAGARPLDLVISPDGLRVYVAITGENALTVINAQTDQVLEKIPVRAKPGGIAISPDGSLVFGCDTDNDRVWVVATATNEILTFVPAGSRPTRIAMHPNGSRVYVTNYTGNSVSVIAAG